MSNFNSLVKILENLGKQNNFWTAIGAFFFAAIGLVLLWRGNVSADQNLIGNLGSGLLGAAFTLLVYDMIIGSQIRRNNQEKEQEREKVNQTMSLVQLLLVWIELKKQLEDLEAKSENLNNQLPELSEPIDIDNRNEKMAILNEYLEIFSQELSLRRLKIQISKELHDVSNQISNNPNAAESIGHDVAKNFAIASRNTLINEQETFEKMELLYERMDNAKIKLEKIYQ